MSRNLIDRENLKIFLLSGEYETTGDIIKFIDRQRVFIEEQRTGHWISHLKLYGCEKDNYQCSECGRSIQLNKPMEELSDYPYCHCGAKMEESEE